MKSSKWCILSAMVAAMGLGQFARASLVVNGDFETGTISGWTNNNLGYIDIFTVQPATNFPSYSGNVNPPYGAQDHIGTKLALFHNGSQNGRATLSQTLTGLSADTQYTLSFDFSSNLYDQGQYGYGPSTLKVSILGASELLNGGLGITQTSSNYTLMDTYSYNFTTGPGDTTAVLSFLDSNPVTTSGSGSNPLLDNVSVVVAVPEPASLGLLAFGGLGLLRRRSTAKTA